jgi:hypothetical protein
LITVAAQNVVEDRVPDRENDDVAGKRVADLPGAHVA